MNMNINNQNDLILFFNQFGLDPKEIIPQKGESKMPLKKEEKILNAIIKETSLTMTDGFLRYYLSLKTGENGFEFDGYAKGCEALMRIMDIVGVDRWEDLKGKYCRVMFRGLGKTVEKIGNIIEDRWF